MISWTSQFSHTVISGNAMQFRWEERQLAHSVIRLLHLKERLPRRMARLERALLSRTAGKSLAYFMTCCIGSLNQGRCEWQLHVGHTPLIPSLSRRTLLQARGSIQRRSDSTSVTYCGTSTWPGSSWPASSPSPCSRTSTQGFTLLSGTFPSVEVGKPLWIAVKMS